MHTKVCIKRFKARSCDRFWGVWFVARRLPSIRSYQTVPFSAGYAPATGQCTTTENSQPWHGTVHPIHLQPPSLLTTHSGHYWSHYHWRL